MNSRALMPAMLKAPARKMRPSGFLERLQANAGKLVRVRPVDAPPGDSRPTCWRASKSTRRMPTSLRRSPNSASCRQRCARRQHGWIAKAKARQDALAAARQIAADAARALGQP